MPASVQVAIVPAAPKSTSSGWATTTSARSTGSASGRTGIVWEDMRVSCTTVVAR